MSPAECPLFAGLEEERLHQALKLLNASEKRYENGSVLKDADTPLQAFGLVMEGRVQVSMTDIDGNLLLLSVVTPGHTFGESLCYLQEDSPIRITADGDSRVLWLHCEGLREDAELMRRFCGMLARRTLSMNDRIQAMSRPTLHDKLIAYFTQCERDTGSRSFDIPMDRAALAAWLGTERSALSRELSAMRRRGELNYRKNHFELLK